jgi:hypothetical protein
VTSPVQLLAPWALGLLTPALLGLIALQIANDHPAPPRPNMVWVPISPPAIGRAR